MSNNYFDIIISKPQGCSPYRQGESYVIRNDGKRISLLYTQLPEEYAIFSDLDDSLLSNQDTEQHEFLSKCLQHLKIELLNIYANNGVVRILPKLSIALDSDDAFVVNWAYTNFRIYFTIEKCIENSFYGIIAQQNDESIFSNSGKFVEGNYVSVINMLLNYVFENT